MKVIIVLLLVACALAIRKKKQYACGTGKIQAGLLCVICSAGTYQPISDTTAYSCTPCPEGQYQDKDRQGTCIKCASGMYQPSKGAVACLSCPAGNYQDQEGQSVCKPCPPGTVSTGNTCKSPCPAS